jgi:hypothetical protein
MRAASARTECKPSDVLGSTHSTNLKGTTMYRHNDACNCNPCPGAGCPCGCQPTATLVQVNDARPACNCAQACGCDAAEQGCLCRQ